MKKKNTRQQELIKIIAAQGLLPVKTLSALLGVSEMTVRRDLEALQYRPAGSEGGLSFDAAGTEYSLLQALEKANEQKDKIGRFAASLIQPNDVIIIDTGSTTERMLRYIPGGMDLTVLCYNANVMLELRSRPNLQLLFCGGVYHPNTELFESPEGIRFIERTRANKVFLSAAGVHRQLGVTCANAYEVPTKTAVIKSSYERILLADSSKFDQVRSAYFCELSEVSRIVTDVGLPKNWKDWLRDRDIPVHVV